MDIMKTRIKQHNGKFFPQYKHWLMWHPIIVRVSYNVIKETFAYDAYLPKSHWWDNGKDAQRAIDKFISNGYCNDK